MTTVVPPPTSVPVPSATPPTVVPAVDPGAKPSFPAHLRAILAPVAVELRTSDYDDWLKAVKDRAKAKSLAAEFADANLLDGVARSVIVTDHVMRSGVIFGGSPTKEGFEKGAKKGTKALKKMGDVDALGSTDPAAPSEAFRQAVDAAISNPQSTLAADHRALMSSYADSQRKPNPKDWYDAIMAKTTSDAVNDQFPDDQTRSRAAISAIVTQSIIDSGEKFGKDTPKEAFRKGAVVGKATLVGMGDANTLGSTDPERPSEAFRQAVDDGIAKQPSFINRKMGWTKRKAKPTLKQWRSWPLIPFLIAVYMWFFPVPQFFGTFWTVFFRVVLTVLVLGIIFAWVTARASHKLIWALVIVECILAIMFIGNAMAKPQVNAFAQTQKIIEGSSCADTGKCSPELVSQLKESQGILNYTIRLCHDHPDDSVCASAVPDAVNVASGKAYPVAPGSLYQVVCNRDWALFTAKATTARLPQCSSYPKP